MGSTAGRPISLNSLAGYQKKPWSETSRSDGKKSRGASITQVVIKVSTKNGTRPECAVFGRAVISAPAKETASFMEFTRERLTMELSGGGPLSKQTRLMRNPAVR